jgi:hypothetical protein
MPMVHGSEMVRGWAMAQVYVDQDTQLLEFLQGAIHG